MSNPAVDITFIALWISVFSFSQLKKDSIGCLSLEMAQEYKSLQA